MCRVESEDLAPGVERERGLENGEEDGVCRAPQDARLGAAGRGARC